MIHTYETYLAADRPLTLEEMALLHADMVSEIGNDQDAAELYLELAQAAARYIGFRSQWSLWSRGEKLDRDSSRTACHNSLIVKFNQLAKYLRLQGHKSLWRDTLGYDEEDPINRKRIGDFGCYIAFVNSLCSR